MYVVALLAVGLLLGRVGWSMLRPTLAAPLFLRSNYRDHTLSTCGGLVLVVAGLVGAALGGLAHPDGIVLAGPFGLGELRSSSGFDLAQSMAIATLAPTALAVALFGLLGLLDDLAGSQSGFGGERGFRGHLGALARGRLTTGGLKLVGGGVGGVALAAMVGPILTPIHPGGRPPTPQTTVLSPLEIAALVVMDGLVIALSANLANLFDRAPARVAKVSTLALLGLAVATGLSPALAGAALVVGAIVGLMGAELDEQVMLGDTGSNAIGAALGLAAVVTLTPGARAGVLVGLLVLNAASERVSFSRVIDRVAVLRWLDRIGRRH